MYTICLIPGDGIGQEVVPAAAKVLALVLPGTRFVEAEAGWGCYQRTRTSLPEATLQAVTAADATLFGATQSPLGPEGAEGYRSPILSLRRRFDLYANLRPTAALMPGTRPINLLIVRENTEGLYSGRERRDGDTAIAERVITRHASERIARVAFEQAQARQVERQTRAAQAEQTETVESAAASSCHRRRSPSPCHERTESKIPSPSGRTGTPRVTIVHKANVLKVTDGLFREACLAVAAEFPDVVAEEMLVDTAAMWLAKSPQRFDVIVTTNLFGDILSDLAAGLVGGLGIAPSANIGAGHVAVFEPVHGSAPDIAGKGTANPLGAILSAAMLLDHLGERAAARQVREAVTNTLSANVATPDLGGRASTAEVVTAIYRELDQGEHRR